MCICTCQQSCGINAASMREEPTMGKHGLQTEDRGCNCNHVSSLLAAGSCLPLEFAGRDTSSQWRTMASLRSPVKDGWSIIGSRRKRSSATATRMRLSSFNSRGHREYTIMCRQEAAGSNRHGNCAAQRLLQFTFPPQRLHSSGASPRCLPTRSGQRSCRSCGRSDEKAWCQLCP